MKPSQKPSLGRIVQYSQPAGEARHNDERTHPAIITHVWSDTCVNLTVFFDNAAPEPRTSVCLRTDDADHNPNAYWEWPAKV